MVSEQRVLVTNDSDFLKFHDQGRHYWGIAYCHQQSRTIGQLIHTLELIWEVLEPFRHAKSRRVPQHYHRPATGVELAGRRESQAADHRAVVVRRAATQGGRVGAPRSPGTEFGFLRANRLLSGSAADALAVGIGGCVTVLEQDAVQIRAELLPLVSDNFVVVEFDLEFEAVTEHFSADLALFRIRSGGEAFQFIGDQPSELRTRDCFLELQPLVFELLSNVVDEVS